MPGQAVLLYDGDCAFCSSSAVWALRLGGRAITAVPWQRADLGALGVSTRQVRDEVVYVDRHGRISGGAAAVAALLADHGGVVGFLGRVLRLPLVRGAARLVYRLVAANRHRLPGGTPACALPAGDEGASPGSRRGTMGR